MQKPPYTFKTPPYSHQEKYFHEVKDLEYYGVFWEMGSGKTKFALDIAGHKFKTGQIEALFLVAPNGVHIDHFDAVKTHLNVNYTGTYWQATPRKSERKALELLTKVNDPTRLKILTMNPEGLQLDSKAYRFAMNFCRVYRTLTVIDEASDFKNPRSSRTKGLLGYRRFEGIKHVSKYRMILDGTPIAERPGDIFAPSQFLREGLLGYNNHIAFRAHFEKLWSPNLQRELYKYGLPQGVVNDILNHRLKYGYLKESTLYDLVGSQLRAAKHIISTANRCQVASSGGRNLEELNKRLQPWSSRVLKSECLDLPDKIFKTIKHTMSKEQGAIYKQVKEELYFEFAENQQMTVKNVLAKYLRLQQVLGGFYTLDHESEPRSIPGGNTRIQLLMRALDKIPKTENVIIWSRFTGSEIPTIVKTIAGRYGEDSVVEYHGEASRDDKQEAKQRIKNDQQTRYFVANQKAGGRGLDLPEVSYMIVFSNDFSARTRLQMIDRAHRIGQTKNLMIIDIICPDTMDEIILDAHTKKKSISDIVTGDHRALL